MASSNASVQLHAIAVHLKEAGERDLRLALTRGLKTGAAPLIPLVNDAAIRQLPKTGGLNKQVASQRITVSVRTSAKTAGVRLTTKAPDTAQTDAGYVRHPTFGRRGKGQWKTQPIPAAKGWWSKTLRKAAPVVTPALLRVMRDIAREIQGR